MRIEMKGNCFACGRRNRHGLQLAFTLDPWRMQASARTVIDRRFIGWEDAVHGGITATLLDEVMVYACGAAGKLVATARLTTRYRKPVPVDTPLLLKGTVIRDSVRMMQAKAQIEVDGVVLADGEGLFAVLEQIEDIAGYFNPVLDNP